jgi:hypothetical protein
MCFNYKVSIITFFIGMITSYNLIKNGNPKYKNENFIIGTFFYFIVSIQLMEYLFWIDLDNELGINHIATLFGPLLSAGQPLILYLIKVLYYKPTKINLIIGFINLMYFIYVIITYKIFISRNILTTTTHENNHLVWPWLKVFNQYFYMILLAINIFYLGDFKYNLVIFLIIYFLYFLSYIYFAYNVGELWCFFSISIPIIMYFISYLIDEQHFSFRRKCNAKFLL